MDSLRGVVTKGGERIALKQYEVDLCSRCLFIVVEALKKEMQEMAWGKEDNQHNDQPSEFGYYDDCGGGGLAVSSWGGAGPDCSSVRREAAH
jgi:hypothetical protein